MGTNQDSVESQLRTRCNVLESQVETLEKQKSKSPEKFVINDDTQAEKKIVVKVGEKKEIGIFDFFIGEMMKMFHFHGKSTRFFQNGYLSNFKSTFSATTKSFSKIW